MSCSNFPDYFEFLIISSTEVNMADFKTVYIQEVHSENLEKVWPAVTGAIENCEFIALDLVSKPAAFPI